MSPEDLALINQLARKELKAEEVYTFSVRLCDDQVDRDFERFSPQTLEELAGLFVGKSGIFDHQWSAWGQSARIYKTEVIREPEKITLAGDGYCWLKGYAYMVRTESGRDLIAEIEGGIKREVSVGCAVERAVCSICGGTCGLGTAATGRARNTAEGFVLPIWKGRCDAYEFSFVAVSRPAPGRGGQRGGAAYQPEGAGPSGPRLCPGAGTAGGGGQNRSALSLPATGGGSPAWLLAQIGLDRGHLKRCGGQAVLGGVAGDGRWLAVAGRRSGIRCSPSSNISRTRPQSGTGTGRF